MKNNVTKQQSLQEGALILILTAVLTKLIGALFKIPLSSDIALGDLGFGYFSAVYDLFMPISTLAISGVPVAISYFISKYVAQKQYENVGQVLRLSKKILVIISLCGFCLLIVLAYPFVKFTDPTGKVLYGYIAILPTVFLCSVTSLYRGYFEGFLNMKPTAVSSLIDALGKLIIGFLFAIVTVKVKKDVALASAAALLGITIATLLSAAYIYFKYKRHSSSYDFKLYSENKDKKLSKALLVMIITVSVSSLASSIVSLVDTLSVRTLLSLSIKDNPDFFKNEYSLLLKETSLDELPTVLYGIKSKAHTLFNIAITLSMALGVSVVPNLSKWEANSKEAYKTVNTALRITSLISFPVSLGFLTLSGRIMSLLFGEGFSSVLGGKMLAIYGIASLFAGFSVILGNILQSFNSHVAVVRNILIATLVKVLLNLFLTVNSISVLGCVYSTLAFYVVVCLLNLLEYSIKFSKKALKGIAFKPLISAVICCASALAFSKISESKLITLVSIIIAAIVYFAILVLMRFFKKEDFMKL